MSSDKYNIDNLPTELHNDEQKQKRKALFQQFDPNNNGYLSLAEVDKGCRDVLQLYDIFKAKKVIMSAFQAAKSINDAKRGSSNSHGPDYIETCEFRLLLVYLQKYYKIWLVFQQIDTSNGSDLGDHRINLKEFQAAIPKLEESLGWKIDPNEESENVFNEIDTNGGKF